MEVWKSPLCPQWHNCAWLGGGTNAGADAGAGGAGVAGGASAPLCSSAGAAGTNAFAETGAAPPTLGATKRFSYIAFGEEWQSLA